MSLVPCRRQPGPAAAPRPNQGRWFASAVALVAVVAVATLAGACGTSSSPGAARASTSIPGSASTANSAPTGAGAASGAAGAAVSALAAPTSAAASPPPVPSASSVTSAPSGSSAPPTTGPPVQAAASAICAAVFPGGVSGGNHCQVTRSRTSAADPDWVLAEVGAYTPAGQLDSDVASVLFNIATHQLIGPTNVGFCGEGTSSHTPVAGYTALPAAVLAGLGLQPCGSPASSTVPANPANPVPATTGPAAGPYAVVAGTWGAHEVSLVISPAGSGQLGYADLSRCPGCSFANAPPGTLDFVLTAISGHAARGKVTASSDPSNYTAGQPVLVSLTAGSPGQLLQLSIGGKSPISLCNSTSAGQCGA